MMMSRFAMILYSRASAEFIREGRRGRREGEMSDITALQKAVLALPEEDCARFRATFSEMDWEQWGQQIKTDSEQGKLDFLIAEGYEARDGQAAGTLNGPNV